MKKSLFVAAAIIAAVAGVTCYNHEQENEMSDMAKENLKALAADDLSIMCFKDEPGNSFLCKCSNCCWGYVSAKRQGRCYGESDL